jgi:glyoxylase-like metal-dependent hydrolase (beta-lactamase superfamily II)
MKVHHLNGGTMYPPLVGRIVCHVLLCETDGGLLLVDTGFGLADVADPAARIGAGRRLLRPVLAPDETIVRQVVALGHHPEDVRHIVLTHLDTDHTGGLADFPWAQVHVTAAERSAANAPATRMERQRYRPVQWAHQPNVVTYGEAGGAGEPWFGFDGVHQLTAIDERVVLVPLAGHTRGHAAVAIDAGARGWLLHAGDAMFDRAVIAGPDDPPEDHRPRRTTRAFERAAAVDRSRLAGNHARLAALHTARPREATVLCAHDPVLFDRAVASTISTEG